MESVEESTINEADLWVDSVMKSMTLEERVGQLFMPASYASNDYFTIRRLRKYVADRRIGGVLFLKGDIAAQIALSDTLQALSDVPLFVAIDAEWGLGMRLEDAPVFPLNGRLGQIADDSLMYDYGVEMARESKIVGVNMIMGPVLDVIDNNVKGVIGYRSFGSDPHNVARLAVSYARGLEDGGVMSVGKHFPGHGKAEGDSHDMLPMVISSSSDLDSIDLYPFQRFVDAGLSGIMVGHLYVPAMDSVRRSSALSPVVTTTYLKEKMGFRGLVITDALNMKGANGSESVCLESLLAGSDIVLAPEDTDKEIMSVLEAVRSGEIDLRLIEEKCRKVLYFKYLFIVKQDLFKVTHNAASEINAGAENVRNEMIDRINKRRN